jgi:hypothetical protein
MEASVEDAHCSSGKLKEKPVHTGLYLVRIGLRLDGAPFLFLKIVLIF